MVFGHPSIEETRFPAIADDLALRGTTAADPDAFALLDPVRSLVAVLGPDEPGGPRGEEYRAHARLVYHAFLHWSAGKPSHALDRDVARELADPSGEAGSGEAGPSGEAGMPGGRRADRVGAVPGPAGWVGLPSTLFWARIEAAAIPEPVNGFFWAAPPEELQVLLVTGMRPDRTGFGTLDARAPFGEAGFGEPFEPRPDGAEAFANILPGGELDGLLSIVTRGEALTLAARALAALEAGAGGTPPSPEQAGSTP